MFSFPVRRAWSMLLNLVGIVLVAIDLAQRSLRDAPAPIGLDGLDGLGTLGVLHPCAGVPGARPGRRLSRHDRHRLADRGPHRPGRRRPGRGRPAGSLAGTPVFALRLAAAGAFGSLLLIGAGMLIAPTGRGAVISAVALLLICGLGGLSRRQYRESEAQSRALLEERIAVEQERAEVAGLSERSRIARDLHDVLAHSLGGLVVQLEAVDALLESGRTGEARDRVQGARKLAVSGLGEARRAVGALREPAEPLSAVVAALAETHRAIGAQAAVRGDADRGVLSAAARVAARRAVQELLTNARRHARGAPTTLDLDWDADRLTITASTVGGRAVDEPSPGGGHGLAGMGERVTEAGGTMTVREGPPFEVVLRLPGEGPA